MIVEVEKQNHGIDLIKIDNDDTYIVFTNYGARIVCGNIMIIILC